MTITTSPAPLGRHDRALRLTHDLQLSEHVKPFVAVLHVLVIVAIRAWATEAPPPLHQPERGRAQPTSTLKLVYYTLHGRKFDHWSNSVACD